MSHPNFFTVVEAARVLRIGRTAAYEQSKVYRTELAPEPDGGADVLAEGADGLPSLVGRALVEGEHA